MQNRKFVHKEKIATLGGRIPPTMAFFKNPYPKKTMGIIMG